MYTAYGELVEHEGQNDIIFKYNGRSGVITGANGLYYMRARYYNPDIKRFINADVVAGSILDSPSLNRYAYVNGNPISYIDPFGLSAENTEPNDFWHNVLDVIGYMPGPIGTVADLTNAALYAVEGRILEAGIAVGCAIGADLLFKGLKYGYKLAKPVLKTGAEMAGTALKVGVRAIREGTEKLVGSAVRKLSKWSVGEHAKNAFKTTANIAGNGFVRTVKSKMDTVVKRIGRTSKGAGNTGAFNGNTSGGNGLGKLTGKEIRVTEKGLNIVKKHLSNPFFNDDGRNTLMINRLQTAMNNGVKVTGADASFYMNEVAEATMMKGTAYNLDTYDLAHTMALQKYGVSPFSVYALEVVMQSKRILD